MLLDKDSTWEYRTLQVPLNIGDGKVPAWALEHDTWALENDLADNEDIVGVMLAEDLMTQASLVTRKEMA